MVSPVQKSCIGLNVSLSSLVKEIIQFFESKEFNNVTALETETGYQVIAGDSKHYKIEKDVSVTIQGKANDFTISLTSNTEERRPSLPLILTSMFGGGYFLLKNFRSEEAMQKLERDFRERISKMIEQAQEPSSQEKNGA
jgi:hypothetical protein